MRNLTYILLTLAVAFGLLGLLFAWWTGARFTWRDNVTGKAYAETWDQPYGSMVFFRMLQSYMPPHHLVLMDTSLVNALPDSTARPSSYVFIGEEPYYDSTELERLNRFLSGGNTALIISKYASVPLMKKMLGPICSTQNWYGYHSISDTVVTFRLKRSSDSFSLYFAHRNLPERYAWNAVSLPDECLPFLPDTLGWFDEQAPNFVALPVGRGQLLLHSAPLAFSNYQLLRPGMQRYAEEVLAELPEGDVYWDAVSRLPDKKDWAQGPPGRRYLPEDHPLAYILKQPALAWAWYLLIGMALAYLLFQAKRRRRIVPILPKNENSSYEFINTIANLHFREKNYRQICYQMMRLFLAQVRERYGLSVPYDPESGEVRLDKQFMPKLAQRSEYPEQRLQELFNQYIAVVQFQPDENMMIELNRAIDSFWKHAK